MRRDYKTAERAAVNGLYHGSNDDMEAALREILEALNPELAALMEDNEDAAFARVNDDHNSSDDEDETEEFMGLEDESF